MRISLCLYAIWDGNYFRRMKEEDAGCTLRTYEKLVLWFSTNWPADLEWPEDVPRPDVDDKMRRAS